jgi:hypothetical protein
MPECSIEQLSHARSKHHRQTIHPFLPEQPSQARKNHQTTPKIPGAMHHEPQNPNLKASKPPNLQTPGIHP